MNYWSSSFLLAIALAGLAAFADEEGRDAGISRVKAVSDGVCTVTKTAILLRTDSEGKNPLADWAAMQPENVKSGDAFVRVDFTLVPEPGSDIRCRADLPLPEKWDGRLWGQGNSGHAGVLPHLAAYVAAGTAAVTTDLGTRAITNGGRTNSKVWPRNIQRDFNWRATHLMTVYGKKIVAAFYGRPCDKAYFCGGSTGGRQAISEAIRFPEDYDGIIANLPDNNAAVNELAVWHLWRQTHDAAGRALFTTNEMRVVADAAVAYRAKNEPQPYAGRFLSDARLSEAEIDGFLALAASRCPSLAEGGKMARLKALYLPLVHDGVCYFNGFAPGAYLGKNMSWMGIVNLRSYLKEHGVEHAQWKDVGWREIDGFLKDYALEFNACSPDLSAFAARGGKLIMTTGWEDQSISPAPIIDYYERVCRKEGGIERTKAYFRLFCIPGCAHGGGKGRAMTGTPGGKKLRALLADWREKGVPPDTLAASYDSGKMRLPVAVYPGLYVQDASGDWTVKKIPRGVAQIDVRCLETKCEVPQ